jgi:hypothetical protein
MKKEQRILKYYAVACSSSLESSREKTTTLKDEMSKVAATNGCFLLKKK